MPSYLNIIGPGILLIGIIAGLAYWWIHTALSDQNEKYSTRNYLQPATYSLQSNVTCEQNKGTANMCDNKVLYPINLPYVNYQIAPIANSCPCTQFIASP